MRRHLLAAISLSLLAHAASLIASPALRAVPHRDQRASAWRVCADAGRGSGSRDGYQSRGQGRGQGRGRSDGRGRARGQSDGRGRGRGQSDGRGMRQPPRQAARPAPGDDDDWEPTRATPQTPRSPRPATPVPEHLMVNLRANGVEQLNGIQERAHSAMSYGLDVVVHAETGAGKTLSFALPLLASLSEEWRDAASPALQGLVVVPTLELAAQISRVLNTLEPGAAAALLDGSEALPASPIVVGPPSMLLKLLSEPLDADDADAKPRKGRRPDRPERGEWFDDWDDADLPTMRPKVRVRLKG
jgi:hypothetical protein